VLSDPYARRGRREKPQGCFLFRLRIREETSQLATKDLHDIEAEIDEAFAKNDLARLLFAQCAWTLLSVVEDHHFKVTVMSPLEAPQAAIYVDGLMNALTYPLQVCHQRAAKGPFTFNRIIVEQHYQLANDWLDRAKDYAHFCTIFPLFHDKKIELVVQGNQLIPTDWSTMDLSYEVYDRFVAKRGPDQEPGLDPNLVYRDLVDNMHVDGSVYSVKFTPSLMESLSSTFKDPLIRRHALPGDWQFTHFSLAQYREVFICLQFMAYGWFVARQIAAADGAFAIAFASAVWTPRKGFLISAIARHTGIHKSVVESVIRYLTFGEMHVRNSDIAIQPIVDLTNGEYAISPFIVTHVHAERNLCVLLNQVPADRQLYSQVVNEKEKQARSNTISDLAGLGLDFKHGQLDETDLDLAIIDRNSRLCLCIEMKWFIEPAEVREILDREEELRRGVVQARKIAKMFSDNNARLMALLEIDRSYDFQAMIGSVNFIGGHRVQHPEVPITKLWHLVAKIRSLRNLREVFTWLRTRSYLPRKDVDYKVTEVTIQSGEWKSRWYAIAHA
jgi:hypothetical protein